MIYDERVMCFKGIDTVSLLTLSGRVLVPFPVGAYQEARMGAIKGQADLLYRNGTFYLAVTLDVPTPHPMKSLIPSVLIWVSSTWLLIARVKHSAVSRLRRFAQAPSGLASTLAEAWNQERQTPSEEAFWQRSQVPQKHQSCDLQTDCSKGQSNNQGIAIEELRHIRQEPNARLDTRSVLAIPPGHSGNSVSFLSYKAALAGVPLHTVDPRNTSRTCHRVRPLCESEPQESSLLLLSGLRLYRER